MRADDPRHGTNAGHRAHFTHGVPMCDPCRAAHAEYKRRVAARKYLARADALTVPSLGVVRRIRALQAIGWSLGELDKRLGHGDGRCKGGPNYLWNVLNRPRVRIATHHKVVALFEVLADCPGPSGRTRATARRNGWHPPSAWLGVDIDDPDAQPDPGWSDPATRGRNARPMAHVVEDFDWLVSQGESENHAAERLGVTTATIRDYRLRISRSQEVA
jgi:hypothetical protein